MKVGGEVPAAPWRALEGKSHCKLPRPEAGSWACTFLTHSQGVGRPMGCPFPGTAARKAACLGDAERASHGTHIQGEVGRTKI